MKEKNICNCDVPAPSSLNTNKLNRYKLFITLGISLAIWIILYYYLEAAADFISFDLLKLDPSSHLGSSVAFFLYDAPKVIMLLVIVVFAVGIIRSFFTPERTRQFLAGKKEYIGNFMAGGLGIVTPFCSCSAVPLFIGFVEAGVPLGVTFTFLIAAPMINEVALVLLFGMFGWRVAVIYIVTGLFIAILSGWIIGRLKLERYIESWVFDIKMAEGAEVTVKLTFTDRIQYAITAVKEIVGKVWPYVLGGIAVGAAIHGYVPEDFLASFMGKNVWWAVPAAVLLGVPMYSNAAGVIPVLQALIEKGAALGTALAFMMAVIGLSLPETIILRKVLKWPLIALFLGIVATGIILIGYLFNIIL
jgi:uncharacterized protein